MANDSRYLHPGSIHPMRTMPFQNDRIVLDGREWTFYSKNGGWTLYDTEALARDPREWVEHPDFVAGSMYADELARYMWGKTV